MKDMASGTELAERPDAAIIAQPEGEQWQAAGPLVAILSDVERLREVPIETVKELARLDREYRAEAARREFAAAFTAAQAELTPVAKRGWNSHTKSRYAFLEDVVAMLDTRINAHGFSRSFATADGAPEGQTRYVLTLRHAGGHQEQHHMDAPADTAGPRGGGNKTPIHGLASAMKYCERYLLCSVWGVQLVDGPDDDGNAAGGVGPAADAIGEEDAKEIAALVEATSTNLDSFLAYFDSAPSIADISKRRRNEALKMLRERKRRQDARAARDAESGE